MRTVLPGDSNNFGETTTCQFEQRNHNCGHFSTQCVCTAEKSSCKYRQEVPARVRVIDSFLTKQATSKEEKPKIHLLEFDERFAVFPEFIHYDFRNPFKLPCKHEFYYHSRT
jgi:hypothetical protein